MIRTTRKSIGRADKQGTYLHDNVYPLILRVFDLLNELNDISVLQRVKDRSTIHSQLETTVLYYIGRAVQAQIWREEIRPHSHFS
jgi:hypothetical protein